VAATTNVRRLMPKRSVDSFKHLLSKLGDHYPTKAALMEATKLNDRQIKDINDGHLTYLNAKKIHKAYLLVFYKTESVIVETQWVMNGLN
jgi:hypothetical protein